MCMAISAGAIVPLLMGKVRDWLAPESQAYSSAVPVACFAYLLLLSLRCVLKPAPQGASA